MEWRLGVLVLWLLRCITLTSSFPHILPDEESQTFDNVVGDETPLTLYDDNDIKLKYLGKLLTNVLLEPWPRGVSPIVYVEETDGVMDDDMQDVSKRSRYYRKYPWKRQNSRYDAENKYLCQPSKEDVFRLLVALHEARRGSRGQMVNFCNRKRPANAVFTNIRFLG